ncbi:MAG: VOC family protein [Bacteriovoracaceae bacterium]|nr:VOC family protein [Bacteriovoracaceae bacterium]
MKKILLFLLICCNLNSAFGGHMKYNNTRLLVTKFDETFLFYRDKLNFKVTWGSLGETYAHFQLPGGGDIGIFDRASMAKVVGTSELPIESTGQDKSSLIFEVSDVDQAYKQLLSKGVVFINKPTTRNDWGIRVVHLRDPNGNLIELMNNLKN